MNLSRRGSVVCQCIESKKDENGVERFFAIKKRVDKSSMSDAALIEHEVRRLQKIESGIKRKIESLVGDLVLIVTKRNKE